MCCSTAIASQSSLNITDLDFSKNPDLEQLLLSLANLKKLNISGCDKLNILELNWKPVELHGYNAGYLLYVKTSPNGKYTSALSTAATLFLQQLHYSDCINKTLH